MSNLQPKWCQWLHNARHNFTKRGIIEVSIRCFIHWIIKHISMYLLDQCRIVSSLLLHMMTSPNGNIFPRYWPFARGIHRSPVNFPHKGQRRGALMFSLIWARINGWVNNREAGDLRRYIAHYDVIVMNCVKIPRQRCMALIAKTLLSTHQYRHTFSFERWMFIRLRAKWRYLFQFHTPAEIYITTTNGAQWHI